MNIEEFVEALKQSTGLETIEVIGDSFFIAGVWFHFTEFSDGYVRAGARLSHYPHYFTFKDKADVQKRGKEFIKKQMCQIEKEAEHHLLRGESMMSAIASIELDTFDFQNWKEQS